MGEQNNLTTLAKRLRPFMRWAAQDEIGATAIAANSALTITGTLSVGGSKLRFYNNYGVTQVITQVHISVDTPPSGAAIIVDIHKNGTTIFTNQAHRPEIAIGANTGYTSIIDVSSWEAGDYIQVLIDQIGSGTPGSDLVLQVIMNGNYAVT